MISRLTRMFVWAWLAMACSLAAAQPLGALGDDFVYRVRPGDTLIGLAGT